MDSRIKWWPYRIACTLLYGHHKSITYPIPGYIHVTTADLAAFLGISTHNLREYLKMCEELGMIDELKVTKGFCMVKMAEINK
jgi:hypothetical protein